MKEFKLFYDVNLSNTHLINMMGKPDVDVKYNDLDSYLQKNNMNHMTDTDFLTSTRIVEDMESHGKYFDDNIEYNIWLYNVYDAEPFVVCDGFLIPICKKTNVCQIDYFVVDIEDVIFGGNILLNCK